MKRRSPAIAGLRQNYPQPKALAGLDIFVYVIRQCAEFRREGRCALGPARWFDRGMGARKY